jgi:N-methylhydantoinase B/oxoprolinase/acetone carboxylase alpha subunit
MMEERRNLLSAIHDSSGRKVERAEQLTVHIGRLKAMLQTINKDV